MSELDLSENAWARGWSNTKRGLGTWQFWVLEVFGGGSMGIFISPASALIFVLGMLVAMWIGTTAAAPIQQRNELRKYAKSLQDEQVANQGISISDAIKYLLDESAWGWTNYPDGHKGGMGEINAARLIRQAATDGDLSIDGRKEINRSSPDFGRFSDIWGPIDKEFWLTHEFDLTVVLDETARWQACETQLEEPNQFLGEPPGYAGLRISKGELESKWPVVNT